MGFEDDRFQGFDGCKVVYSITPYCFPNPSNRTLSDPGPAQVLIEMDAFNRKGLHLNALVLEVKSHSSSSDLNELSLGLHMDVTRCN